MTETLFKMLPCSLAAAINPLGILIIFFLLSRKDKPVVRAWLFLAGSTTVLIILTVFAQELLKFTFNYTGHPNLTSALIDIALGLILIILSFAPKRKKHQITINKTGLWEEFIGGFLFMAIFDLETIVFYLAAIKLTFDSHLDAGQNMILFAINLLITMSTMALPVFVTTIIPNQSAKILNALNKFVTKKGNIISKVVLLIIAAYLFYNGIKFFF